MNAFEWATHIVVIALLAATLPTAFRLERALRAVRADRAALEAGASGMHEAAQRSEAVLERMRTGAEAASRQVSERIAVVESMRDDLRYLLERGEALADRLEAAVSAARPLIGAAPAAEPRSEAERELIRALGMPR